MDNWAAVFLGIIALSSLIQAALFVALFVGAQRAARKVEELQASLEREIRPRLETLTRITDRLAEMTDRAAAQVPRLESLVDDTVDKVEKTTGFLRQLVLRPLRPVLNGLALVKGVQRGVDVYRRLGTLEQAGRQAPSGTYSQPEHHFV